MYQFQYLHLHTLSINYCEIYKKQIKPEQRGKSLEQLFHKTGTTYVQKHMSRYLVLIVIDTCAFKLGVYVQCIDMKKLYCSQWHIGKKFVYKRKEVNGGIHIDGCPNMDWP